MSGPGESADVADRVAAIQADAEAALAEDDVFTGIIDAGTLQQWADTLTELVAEARVHISDEGFTVRAVEPGSVAMFNPLELSPDAFEAFASPGAATVGVPLETLDERLGRAGSGDLVELTLNMSTRRLTVSYRTLSLDLALIDPDAIREEPDTTDLDLPNTVTITGEQLQDGIGVADMVSDQVRIAGRPDEREVVFSGDGDTDRGEMVLSDGDVLDASVDESCSSLFSTEYLTAFAGPIPADAEVTIRFGEELPVRLSYAAAEDALTAEALCAPRIENQ